MNCLVRRILIILMGLAVSSCLLFSDAARAETAPLLRVLLRRLNIADRVVLKLEGQYLLKSGETAFLFPRETEMTVELRDGRLIVFSSGISVILGKSLTLTRVDDGAAAPALRIADASGLYPGDLSLSVSEGRIQPVLSLDLEDYLLGVVPNEMSESFPLEALKAQAVCARTYAMRKMSRSGSWDVVDTTNDQVFRAISDSNVNSAKAVADTAGLILTKDSRLVESWYSASNGGQTELPSHVWGGDDYTDCYAMVDDPWDIGNPDSLIRTVSLPKDGSGLYRRITALLREAVFSDSAWVSGGYDTSESAFRIDGLSSMKLKAPRYPAPSRLMTELEVTLSVSGRKVAGGTIGSFESVGPVTVTLQVFPDVLDALGLRVANTGNEITTVEETETAFILKTGRFGHGVGLSQRGAQWMAKQGGKTFDEILAFYFPGSTISQYKDETAPLESAPALLLATPAPESPAPSSRPTLMPVTVDSLPEGAYLASVEGIADGSTLNLRSDPSPAASVLMRLLKHQRLIVLDEMDVPGWARVRTDDIEGYVMTGFLSRVE